MRGCQLIMKLLLTLNLILTLTHLMLVLMEGAEVYVSNPKAAMDFLQEAVRLNPLHLDAYHRIALSFFNKGS